jgi:hypothetical protein
MAISSDACIIARISAAYPTPVIRDADGAPVKVDRRRGYCFTTADILPPRMCP